MNEARIQKLIFEKHCDRDLVVPNAYYRSSRWEMDALVVTKAGFTYEYEIKCSHSDFLNEQKSKKIKHKYMDGNAQYNRYYANYFYFVCPAEVIKKDEVWDNRYGLMWVMNKYHLKLIKRATKIHDIKIPDKEYRALARKMMYKLFNNSDKYRIRANVV